MSSTSSLSSLTSAPSYIPRPAPTEYEHPQDAECFAAELKRRDDNFNHDEEQETSKEALDEWLQSVALQADQKMLQAAVRRTPACCAETAWYYQVMRENAQAQEISRLNAFNRKIRVFESCWWLPPMRKSAVAGLPSPFLTKEENAIWM
jgi:hypothetical protein